MEQNLENSSEKTINDKWLDNIYNILLRLENSDKLASEGCMSIIDFVESPQQFLPLIQYKNYSIFLTDFEILINNSQKIIGNKKYKEFVRNINTLRELEKNVGGFLVVNSKNISRTKKYYLKPIFNHAIKIISKMRRDIVSCLWKVLSPSAKDSGDPLPQ